MKLWPARLLRVPVWIPIALALLAFGAFALITRYEAGRAITNERSTGLGVTVVDPQSMRVQSQPMRPPNQPMQAQSRIFNVPREIPRTVAMIQDGYGQEEYSAARGKRIPGYRVCEPVHRFHQCRHGLLFKYSPIS